MTYRPLCACVRLCLFSFLRLKRESHPISQQKMYKRDSHPISNISVDTEFETDIIYYILVYYILHTHRMQSFFFWCNPRQRKECSLFMHAFYNIILKGTNLIWYLNYCEMYFLIFIYFLI